MTATKPVVLLLDDEELIRELMAVYLEDFDEFVLLTASSGEQALDVLSGAPADVAVVDMRLPGMNGEAFVLAAAARGLCRKFLIHTGSVDMAISDELRQAGVTEHDLFIKPVGVDVILARIREVLAQEDE